MELFLNTLWLAFALLAFGMCLRQRRFALEIGREEITRSVLALGCALVLFFPIISLTDDLHFNPQMMEESSSRKQIRDAANAKAGASSHHAPSFTLAAVPVLGEAHAMATPLAPVASLPPAMGLKASASGRAPPATFLL